MNFTHSRNNIPAIRLVLAAVAALVVAAGQVQAVTILVEPPGNNNQGNSFPTNTDGMHWQQVYDKSFFGPSPFTINSFGFFGFGFGTETVSYGSDFTVRMSTTTKAPGSLSDFFSANVGADQQLVLSGPITLSALGGVFTTFMLTNPFLYDSTKGNLLIDVSHGHALTGQNLPFLAYSPTPSGLERIAVNQQNATIGTTDNFGELVTLFDVNAVPEPSSLLLFGLGILGLLLAARRRRT